MFPEGARAQRSTTERKGEKENMENRMKKKKRTETIQCLTAATGFPQASSISCASDQTDMRTGDLRLRWHTAYSNSRAPSAAPQKEWERKRIERRERRKIREPGVWCVVCGVWCVVCCAWCGVVWCLWQGCAVACPLCLHCDNICGCAAVMQCNHVGPMYVCTRAVAGFLVSLV